jgi:chromosome segregation ATPase
LLTLLDDGAFRPIRREIFKKREPLCQQLREQRKTREAAKQTASTVEEELKSYVDYTPDMLSNLRVQQLQLEVELAGVQARIATCEKFLARPNLKSERQNQLEDVKVAAEIELSGFEARRMKSEEFIRKVKTKNVLAANFDKATSAHSIAQNRIRELEQQIKNIDAAIHAYAPLPLVDNKIVVQPLEWTQ